MMTDITATGLKYTTTNIMRHTRNRIGFAVIILSQKNVEGKELIRFWVQEARSLEGSGSVTINQGG